MNNSSVKKGLDFEKKCADKLKQLGFTDVSLTKYTDYGADIVANDGYIKYVFQCKNVKSKQGVKSVQEILTAKHFYSANKCGVISVSDFTPQAYKLAKPNYCILLTSTGFLNLKDKSSLISDSIDKLSRVSFDYDIIKSYEKLKRDLQKTPTWRQLDKSLRYQIKKQYGSYSVFVEKIGDKFSSSKPTDEHLITEYKRIRAIVGKTLSANDIKKHSTLPYNSFKSYPLTKLQKECGDRPNLEKGISKETLISEYLNLAKKLGRNPTRKDLNKHGQHRYSYYAHRWKNLGNFLSEANISSNEVVRRRYSKNETVLMYCLIEALIRAKENNLKIEINSTILKNLKYNDKILFDRCIITNKFNNYDSFIKALDADKEYRNIRQQLQQLLIELVKK